MNNKDINLIIEDFRDSLIKQCNESQLPAAVVYYIVKDVYGMVADQYQDYIENMRRAEVQQQVQEESDTSLDE